MTYLKPLLVGFAAAFLVPVLWFMARVMVPVASQFIDARTTGSGGIGFVSVDSGELLVAAVLGFVAGFAWQVRRMRKSGFGPQPSPGVR